MGHPDLGVRQEGSGPVSYRLVSRMGSTASLLGFTVLVTVLAACGLTRLVP